MKEWKVETCAASDVDNGISGFQAKCGYSLPAPSRYVEAEQGEDVEKSHGDIVLGRSTSVCLNDLLSAPRFICHDFFHYNGGCRMNSPTMNKKKEQAIQRDKERLVKGQ